MDFMSEEAMLMANAILRKENATLRARIAGLETQNAELNAFKRTVDVADKMVCELRSRIAELEREKGELAEDARRWRLQAEGIATHEANHERYARERGED